MCERCAIPGCERTAPRGNPLCVECYFALPPALARMIVRARVERDRAMDAVNRAAREATLATHLRTALTHLPKMASARTEPDAWSETGYRGAAR